MVNLIPQVAIHKPNAVVVVKATRVASRPLVDASADTGMATVALQKTHTVTFTTMPIITSANCYTTISSVIQMHFDNSSPIAQILIDSPRILVLIPVTTTAILATARHL